MATKSLLINFAGYPVSPRMLVPDNGLASLAGALIEKGHQTIILDYSTVDIVKRLFPHEYKNELNGIITKIMKASKEGNSAQSKDIDAFHVLDNKINEYEKKQVKGIADEISKCIEEYNIDFVGMKLWIGDGFDGSVVIAEELKRLKPNIPVFGGGPHVDWFRDKILEISDAFDLLVYGEGEEVITMLADYVEKRKK